MTRMSRGSSPPISAAQLAALPPEFRAVLQSVIDHDELMIAELKAELASVRQTPWNSSLPPSTEHPHAHTAGANEAPAAKTPQKKRKRGGQKGHPQHARPLLDVEQCDEVVTLRPKSCRGCGGKLSGDDPQPLRHQVWELPQPAPIITEYQQHRLTCAGCGTSTCAELPAGVPEHTSGPRRLAITAILRGLFRQSQRRTALALHDVFGVPCCAGWVVKQQERATAALTPCYEEVAAALPSAPVVHCDETPFQQGTAKAWIGTFVASTFTLFAIRLTRAAAVPVAVLGRAFAGAICSDRYAGYNFLNDRRQLCWAHLKRDFQGLIDSGGEGQVIGERLMALQQKVFEIWHRYRAGRLRHDTLRKLIERDCWSQFHDILDDGTRCPHAPTVTLCRDLFQRFDQLWQFQDIVGLEPTNNRGERSLRHAVIWRKLSHGTHSESGSRFVETLLTVVETCRQQNRHPIDFLTEAIAAPTAGKPTPKLLYGV